MLFVREVAGARAADFYLAFATPVALTTSTVEAIERLGSQLKLRKKENDLDSLIDTQVA